MNRHFDKETGRMAQIGLTQQVQARSMMNDEDKKTMTGGQLNPTWVEWLMAWPLGWTALEPLAMDKYQQWQRSHGGCLLENKLGCC